MERIYLDNSSTSFPKAPGLGEAIGHHTDFSGFNISRGTYRDALDVSAMVAETRDLLCTAFGCTAPRNVIFTAGATAGINTVLKGLLRPGDRILTSSMEHNAIARPLWSMSKAGIVWEKAPCRSDGSLDVKEIEDLIDADTRLVMVTHCSNVCGTILPVNAIGSVCRKHGVFFAVDAAQSAGSEKINMTGSFIDALIVPAHKGLMGPQGIGALMISDAMACSLLPLTEGGTGSMSDSLETPLQLPDRFEAGTMNLPGIAGMNHSLKFLDRETLDAVSEKKKMLTEKLISECKNINGISLKVCEDIRKRGPVVSVDFRSMDNANASLLLEKEYGIMTRCGLHCSPMGHRTIGTFPRGTVRFSPGYFNTEKDILKTVDAIASISG